MLETLTPLLLFQHVIGMRDPPPAILDKIKAAPTMMEKLVFLGDSCGHLAKAHPMPRTPVLLLVRNAKVFMQFSFPGMMLAMRRALRASGHPEPRFYIFENDSEDGTQAEIRKHDGPLVITVFDKIPKRQRPSGHPRSSDRCGPMAMLRNALRVMALRDLVCSSIAIMVDVDVWYTSKTVATLITALHKHNLDISTPLSLQTRRHYFDTYALLLPDEDPLAYKDRRDCILDGCGECEKWRTFKGIKKPRRGRESNNTIRVKSAFGGLAVIRSKHLMGQRRPWSSQDNLCEHVSFCMDKNVAIITNAPARWSIETSPAVARWLNQHFLT